MKVTVRQRQDDKVHTDRASVDRGPDDSALQFRRSYCGHRRINAVIMRKESVLGQRERNSGT